MEQRLRKCKGLWIKARDVASKRKEFHYADGDHLYNMIRAIDDRRASQSDIDTLKDIIARGES